MRGRGEHTKQNFKVRGTKSDSICRMLAMKNTLTKDDLIGAARACKDSPLALDVLDDLARAQT